jgi:hypothetical protein
MIGIYKIVNGITKDLYIGSSRELENRKIRHFKDLRKNKHHSIILQRAVNKYGIHNFTFEIIEYCNEEELMIREQYYFDTLFPLYNIAPIAGRALGIKHSKESNAKKRKYALENNVRPPSSTWIDRQKSVKMLDYNTLEVLNTFESISEACRFIGKNSTYCSTISSCCENKRYSAFGYRWCYIENSIENLRAKKEIKCWNKGLKINNRKSKKVNQYDLQNNFIKEWSSVKEAEKIYGKGISNCALGKSKTSNGYIWKYSINK